MQGMDKGILFCTYNLLIAKTAKKSEVQAKEQAAAYKFSMTAGHQYEDTFQREARREAQRGEAEFGVFLLPADHFEWRASYL